MIFPPPRGLEDRVGRLGGDEHTGEIGVDHRPPLRDAEVFGSLADADPGIVHQDVEAAEAGDGRAHHGLGEGLVGDVDLHRRGRRAEGRDLLQRRGVLGRIARGDHDLGPGAGQALGDPQADAAVAAGDERRLAGQVEQLHAGGPTM